MGDLRKPLWRQCTSYKQEGLTSHVWVWTLQNEAIWIYHGDDKPSYGSSHNPKKTWKTFFQGISKQ